jgi:hypothetical protein
VPHPIVPRIGLKVKRVNGQAFTGRTPRVPPEVRFTIDGDVTSNDDPWKVILDARIYSFADPDSLVPLIGHRLRTETHDWSFDFFLPKHLDGEDLVCEVSARAKCDTKTGTWLMVIKCRSDHADHEHAAPAAGE